MRVDSPGSAEPGGRGFLELELQTSDLGPMSRFYESVLGFSVRREESSFTVKTGETLLRFTQAPPDSEPYYHVAWAVSSNLFEASKAWLVERLSLLEDAGGRREFHFRQVNRRAVYFADPADNVLEFISLDDLEFHHSGPFGIDAIASVNHVGLVVRDMNETIETIGRELALEPRYQPQPTFTTIGNAYRHLTLVPEGRPWLPERRLGAKVFPIKATLDGDVRRSLALPQLGAELNVSPTAPSASGSAALGGA